MLRTRLSSWGFALTLGACLSAGAAEPWRVVILQGTDPSLPASVEQDRAFRRVLEAAAPVGVTFYTDPLDGMRFRGAELMPEFLALLGRKYQHQPVDLVVGTGPIALDFLEKHQAQVWPGAAVLLLGLQQDTLVQRGIGARFAYLPVRIDVDGTLALAEALQPRARRLVVVAGASDFDRGLSARTVARARARSARAWDVELWQGLPLPELRARLQGLDSGSAVVYTSMFRDNAGRSYHPYAVVKPMAEASRAPIYGWYRNYLPEGMTAGSVLNFDGYGARAGELAAAILQGRLPPVGAPWPAPAAECTAHAGKLALFGLEEAVLPRPCQVLFRPPSLWREHQGELLLGLAVLSLQALTIVALLVQQRRRRRAEDEAAQRRSELMRAVRVAAVGEISASIAHEVGQPLGAILANAGAAELMLERGTPEPGELRDILADVRRDALRAHEVVRRLRALLEKHAVEFAPLDLRAAVEETLALLEPEARRRGIALEQRLAPREAPVCGDRVQLQQVVLNLAINAMDAMQETAPVERVLAVELQAAESGYALAVADRGHGIQPTHAQRLFDSFFTTKPHGMGLGLAIVRTVLDAHGGHVQARPREGGGTVFTVWLARHRAEPTAAGQAAHAA